MTYVVVVEAAGEPPRVAGPYRHAGRAEGACASIDALDLEGVRATVVPCLPVEAWTVGLSPAPSPGVDAAEVTTGRENRRQ